MIEPLKHLPTKKDETLERLVDIVVFTNLAALDKTLEALTVYRTYKAQADLLGCISERIVSAAREVRLYIGI